MAGLRCIAKAQAKPQALISDKSDNLQSPLKSPCKVLGRPVSELVFSMATGAVLHSRDSGICFHPASMTKLMTLDMLFSALEQNRITLDTPVVFSVQASQRPNTKLGVRAGQKISVAEAMAALAVHSCNDVATAVAEMMAGTEQAFAAAMTVRAHQLGLANSNFTTASGLPDPDNFSTARDIAVLGATMMVRHSLFFPVLGLEHWTWQGRSFANTNHLLGLYPGLDAGKTGYTRESGFHLFATASRNSRRVIAVVAGYQDAVQRDLRMTELLDDAFGKI